MAVKKTIAIVSDTGNELIRIAGKLRPCNFRILLVSKNIANIPQVLVALKEKNEMADIEAIDCVKDGCWEADVIIISIANYLQQEVAEVIRDVVTQKFVITISGSESSLQEWQELLPYSKVIHMALDDVDSQIQNLE